MHILLPRSPFDQVSSEDSRDNRVQSFAPFRSASFAHVI
jgi:hypothetical protein